MLVETPELEKAGSKRSSQILDNFNIDGESPHNSEKMSHDQVVSDYLRSEGGNGKNGKNSKAGHNSHANQSPHESFGSRQSEFKSSPTERPRPSFMNSDDHRTDSNSPGRTVARADIRASAEKILYTFVLPGSEREIVLPEQILNHIIHAIEEEGRDDPEVFNDAKEYVFQAMERDAFPGFLQAKALGNLVPLSMLLRLGIGLACLFGGFWGGFYMILTNKSRALRCWVSYFLPLTSSLKLTNNPAHHPLPPGLPPPHLLPIQTRRLHGLRRLQRIHVHELVTHQRAVRKKVAAQASIDGIHDLPRRGPRAIGIVHFCAWD
jgi:Regulator of G protein signaling domain